MPACARTGKVADQPTIGNLFLPVPDTDFRDFLSEVDDLARFAPEIITAIEADLDLHAREGASGFSVGFFIGSYAHTHSDGPVKSCD